MKKLLKPASAITICAIIVVTAYLLLINDLIKKPAMASQSILIYATTIVTFFRLYTLKIILLMPIPFLAAFLIQSLLLALPYLII